MVRKPDPKIKLISQEVKLKNPKPLVSRDRVILNVIKVK